MSGFSNPIVGGQSSLIRDAIQSSNYVPGLTGWQIAKSGSAEFNNLVVRGVFDGTNFEINAHGIFFYSGTPALGNLIAWAANSNGTDAHGNAYYKGLGTTLPGSQVSLLQDGVLAIGSVAQTVANTQALFDWISDGESALTSGRVNVSDPAQAVLDLQSKSKSGITNGLAYFEVGKLILGITATAWYDDNAQALLVPKVGATISGAAETWHAMPAFGTGFSHGSNPAPSYKLFPDNTVAFAGEVNVTSGTTSGNIVTLPTSLYFPITGKVFAVEVNAGTPATSGTARIVISAAGVVSLASGPTGAAYSVSLDGIRYPLDI